MASPIPLNTVLFNKEDFQEDGVTLVNQVFSNLTQKVNELAGHAGPIQLANHIDMGGRNIRNLGLPVDPTDAVSRLVGDQLFGAAAVQPQMEQLGKQVLQTTRQLNNKYQREQYSSFLNGLVSTPPTTNTATVSAAGPSGGSVVVTITGGFHQYVDGSQIPFAAFNDTIALPVSYTMGSLVRAGNSVAASTTAPNLLTPGETFYYTGDPDSSFDGQFVVDTIISSTAFTYTQFAPDASSGGGGTLSLGGVYYYYLQRDTNVLGRSGGFTTDTLQNRLGASIDGQTIIAIIVVNGGGLVTAQSAAGATPPATTAGNRLLLRL